MNRHNRRMEEDSPPAVMATDTEAAAARLEADRLRRLKRRWLVAVVLGLLAIRFAQALLLDARGHLRPPDAIAATGLALFAYLRPALVVLVPLAIFGGVVGLLVMRRRKH